MFTQNAVRFCEMRQWSRKNTFGLLFLTWTDLIALWSVRQCARLPPHHFLLSLSGFSCLTSWIYQRQRTAASKTDLRLISSRIRVMKGHVFGSTRPLAVFPRYDASGRLDGRTTVSEWKWNFLKALVCRTRANFKPEMTSSRARARKNSPSSSNVRLREKTLLFSRVSELFLLSMSLFESKDCWRLF